MANRTDEKLIPFEILLDGSLHTADDPVVVGRNFKTLKNLRYGAAHPKGIGGMSKINTSALANPHIRNGYHFVKEQPNESHLLVQAYDTNDANPKVYENTTAIPGQGDFSATALHTDSSGGGLGRFSSAPGGSVAYCNGVDTMIWGGDEFRIAQFINADLADGDRYWNFTEQLTNTLTDSLNTAVLKPTTEGTPQTSFYIGVTRPIQGIKIYIKTANTNATGLTVEYFDGTNWTGVSNLSDGTVAGGKTLAQTGSITFDSTVAAIKVINLNGLFLYWYRVTTVLATCSATTELYYVTVDAPLQTVKDIWDGTIYSCLRFMVHDHGTGDFDYTGQVYAEDYNAANAATYAQVTGIGTDAPNDYLEFGFVDRMTALKFVLVAENENTTVNSTMTIKYWNGDTWTSVGLLDDETKVGTSSFARSGITSWFAPASSSEFKARGITALPLYYYRVYFAAALSVDTQLDFVGGIPAQKVLRGYKFALHAKDRLWLCSNTDADKNVALCSMKDAPDVYNGDDTTSLYFGDNTELTTGIDLFSRLGSSLYNISLFFKANELYGVSGNSPYDFIQYQISSSIGCPAPLTLKATTLQYGEVNKNVVLWQGTSGIYMFDNTVIIPIHDQIKDYFDKRNSGAINTSKIADSVAFIDEENMEYHWLFASGSSTRLDKELVYSIEKNKWFEISRGPSRELQCGFKVYDTGGNTYTYGAIRTGYLERLENGNSFNGAAIIYELEIGDVPLYEEAGTTMETEIRYVKLIAVAKTNTTNEIVITHYGDTKTSGSSYAQSANVSGKRLIDIVKSHSLGPHVFHRFKLEFSTNNEAVGFEPIAIVGFIKTFRQDIK